MATLRSGEDPKITDKKDEEPLNEIGIHDLPDGCLAEILSRVDTTPLPPLPLRVPRFTDGSLYRTSPVRHPLQCAFICKRWHSVYPETLRSLSLDMDRFALGKQEKTAATLAERFALLSSLTLTRSTAFHSYQDFLTALSPLAPRLRSLDLRCWITTATVSSVSHFLTLCPNLEALRVSLSRSASLTEAQIRAFLDVACELPLATLRLEYTGLHSSTLWARLGATKSLRELHLKTHVIPPASGAGNLVQILNGLDWAGGTDDDGLVGPSLNSFEHLRALSTLSVRYSQTIAALPASLGLLARLTRLEVDRMDSLVTLPEEIRGLGGCLRHLSVTNCASFLKLPEAVGELRMLRVLRVDKHSVLPQSLENMASLQGLYVSGRLVSVEDALAQMGAL